MKNEIIIIIIILLSITGIEAQNHWVQLNFPDTLHIKCITTNDYGDIFVGVGYNNEQGGVLRSTNEGMTWELVYDDGDNSILSIDVDEDGRIYAGSINGLIPVVISADNGDSWLSFNTPSGYNGNVTEIECVNSEVFISRWESGGGVLLRTNDNGNSWDSLFCCLNPSSDITSIKVDSLNDIIISTMGFQNNTGGVYKSTDDGVTWELLGLFNHQIMGMDVNANSEIFTCDWSLISGDNCGINAMYSNSNEFERILPGSNFTDLKINSEGDIFCSGYIGVIFSEDNGYSFNHFDTTLQNYINHIHISNDDFVYVAGNSSIARSALTTATNQISSSERKDDVIVYPNPATNSISFKSNLNENKNISLKIVDMYGNCMFTKSIQYYYRPFSIDIKHLKPGTYIVEVSIGTRIRRQKFIKFKP